MVRPDRNIARNLVPSVIVWFIQGCIRFTRVASQSQKMISHLHEQEYDYKVNGRKEVEDGMTKLRAIFPPLPPTIQSTLLAPAA